MVDLLATPLVQCIDANGNPFAGGTLDFYIPSTTTRKNTWSNSAGTTSNSNPVVLDAAGRAIIWGSGQYRCVLKDAAGNLIWDQVTGVSTAETVPLATIAALRALTDTTITSVEVAGYHSTGDGGGGAFGYVSSDTTSTDNGGTIIVDGAGRRWYRLTGSKAVSVHWFGAYGDGTHDDTAAFNAALGVSKNVTMAATTYLIAGTVTLTQDGTVLSGAGMNATTLTSAATSGSILTHATGLAMLTLRGFTLARAATPSSGAGLTTVVIDKMVIEDVRATGQYMGFKLGSIAYGEVNGCIAERNYSHGYYLTNDATHNTVQWALIDCLSQFNDGWGAAVVSVNNTAGATVTCTPWVNFTSFANTGGGITLLGSNTAQIWGFILLGGILGSDNYSEIFFDTYGGNNFIEGVYLELAGRLATGSSQQTAASHTGNGIETTAAVRDVTITGCGMASISYDGVASATSVETIVSGCRITNCGLTSGSYASVVHTGGGYITVTGSRLGSYQTGNTSQYGISVSDGSLLTAVGNDLRANSLGAIAIASNYGQANISGNFGYVSHYGGQVALAATATSVVVTHLLSLTSGQTPIQVLATPLTQIASGVAWWIDTITQTQFTLHVSAADPSNITYWAWRASTTACN